MDSTPTEVVLPVARTSQISLRVRGTSCCGAVIGGNVQIFDVRNKPKPVFRFHRFKMVANQWNMTHVLEDRCEMEVSADVGVIDVDARNTMEDISFITGNNLSVLM